MLTVSFGFESSSRFHVKQLGEFLADFKQGLFRNKTEIGFETRDCKVEFQTGQFFDFKEIGHYSLLAYFESLDCNCMQFSENKSMCCQQNGLIHDF